MSLLREPLAAVQQHKRPSGTVLPQLLMVVAKVGRVAARLALLDAAVVGRLAAAAVSPALRWRASAELCNAE